MAEEQKPIKLDQPLNANPVSANGTSGAAQKVAVPTPSAGSTSVSAPPLGPAPSQTLAAEPQPGGMAANGNGQGKVSILQQLMNIAKPSAGAALNDGNVFTKLFGKSDDQKTSAGESFTMPHRPESLKNGASSISNLLGPKPIFSRRDFAEEEKKSSKVAKTLFRIAVVFFILTYGFFYTQLEPHFTLLADQFGPNVASQFESSNAELQKNQTDLNLIQYRLARLMLDEVNTKFDSFQKQKAIVDSDQSTERDKQSAASELAKIGTEVKQILQNAQKIFNQPLGVDIFSQTPITPENRENQYESLLKDALENAKQKAATGPDGKPNKEESNLVDSVLRLVGNKAFRSSLRFQDFGKISDDDLSDLMTKIREESIGQLSALSKIRKQRIDWAKVIQNVNTVTRKADLYYGQGLFKTVGGFLFSSYRFDSKTGRISITGVTKTSDSKTFSFISKLVDSIEKSAYFKDIDFRSFAKSRDENGDFSSSINLEFSLQNGFDPRDDQNSADTAPAADVPQASTGPQAQKP